MAAFQRATSAARQDQFVAGRLFRDVHVVSVRSPESARLVEDAIGSARRVSLDWVTPDLPTRFTLSEYVRQLFRTSFRFEVRPETDGRADALFDAQAGRLQATEDGAFSLPGPPSRGQTLRRRLYLEWSRVRATARWTKHAVTFVAPPPSPVS